MRRRSWFLQWVMPCLGAMGCTSVLIAPNSDGPLYSEIVVAGNIQNDRITEASGLARSNHRNDILWTMNDGGPPVLYAVGTDGSDYGSLTLRNARNVDWEDLAAFEFDSKPYLLIADTGDNEAKRPFGTIYIVEEPQMSRGQHIEAEPAWQIRFSYPDGPLDCESVAVDLSGERILLLSKRTIPATLYDLPLRPNSNDVIRARRITDLSTLPQPGKQDIARALPDNNWHWQPAAMDLSADARTAAILTYKGVYLFVRRPGEIWTDAFARQAAFLDLAGNREAEAVTLSKDGKSIFVTLEGRGAAIFRFDREQNYQRE